MNLSVTRAIRARPFAAAVNGASTRLFSSAVRRQEIVKFQIDGQGIGVGQDIQVRGAPHILKTDTYPAFGGSDSAPSPLHFSLASLSSCTQVTGAIVAKDHGIKLGQWQVAVDGNFDPSVLVAGADGNSNWKGISLNVKVATDADQAAFDKWTNEVERRCPVTQLFKRSGADWKSAWKNEAI